MVELTAKNISLPPLNERPTSIFKIPLSQRALAEVFHKFTKQPQHQLDGKLSHRFERSTIREEKRNEFHKT